MPKMQAKMAISRTTRRFLKQSATNWSIIEAHGSLDRDALAGLEAGFDCRGRSLLIGDVDIAALERPLRDLDEHAGLVVGHEQRRGRHSHLRHRRRNESRVRKHIGLHHLVRIIEGDADLFFFQAEDGIRDLTVTGVQTCALPISWQVLWMPSVRRAGRSSGRRRRMRAWKAARSSRKNFSGGTGFQRRGLFWSRRAEKPEKRSGGFRFPGGSKPARSEKHTSEIQSQ